MTTDLAEIDTPAFLVDEAIALENIRTFQAHCDKAGLNLRPHIKTHKAVRFAQAQLDAGATGITCQKVSEAEAMAVAGIDDIFVTYNILGVSKLSRLYALSERVEKLAVVADNMQTIDGLAASFSHSPKPLRVLVECDTGAGRCGVQTPEAAVELAQMIKGAAGLTFGGLMTYPATGGAKVVTRFMRQTVDLLSKNNVECPVVSSGGSPDMWEAATNGVITEYRIGTYIYNDRSLVRHGSCNLEQCAGHVIATVVSTPTPNRAVIDAGSKVLTSDLLGFSDYGYVVGHPEIKITGLSEEHGILEVDPKQQIPVGTKLRIVPNHVCVISNMFDQIWIETADGGIYPQKIDARGMVL